MLDMPKHIEVRNGKKTKVILDDKETVERWKDLGFTKNGPSKNQNDGGADAGSQGGDDSSGDGE